MSIKELVKRYVDNGYEPFPLARNSKVPRKGSSLYKINYSAKFYKKSNIGLFPGSDNNLRVIDVDNYDSRDSVISELKRIGIYDLIPIVQTPTRNGLHFYIRVYGVPEGAQSYYLIDSDIGKGEFRINRPSYVVAPGSKVSAGEYKFVQGDIDTIHNVPILSWNDISWLLMNKGRKQYEELTEPPIRLIHRNDIKPVIHLFEQLTVAEKGQSIKKVNFTTGELSGGSYPSRSEAEAAVVTRLILYGWTFDEIYKIFEEKEPTHYLEISDDGYLRRSYNRMLNYLAHEPPRPYITDIYKYASKVSWPGKYSEIERKVLLTVLAKAWQFCSLSPIVEPDEFNIYVGIEKPYIISRALMALVKKGYIRTYEKRRNGYNINIRIPEKKI